MYDRNGKSDCIKTKLGADIFNIFVNEQQISLENIIS